MQDGIGAQYCEDMIGHGTIISRGRLEEGEPIEKVDKLLHIAISLINIF